MSPIYTGRAAAGGGGVTDHGALTGLADDDHTAYLTTSDHSAVDHEAITGVLSATEHSTTDHAGVTGVPAADGYAGLIWTADPLATDSPSNAGATNRMQFGRVQRGGTITKVGLRVMTSSGNISVAAYQNSGTGRSAVPGTRLATSGAVACPATGWQEVSLGGSITLAPGDWLALSCDNLTAQFLETSFGNTVADMSKGLYGAMDTAHPAPTAVTPLTGMTVIRCFVLIGVP